MEKFESQKVPPYWSDAASVFYRDGYGHPNTMNAVRLRIVLDCLKDKEPGRLLDAGCGGAFTTNAFLEAGWEAEGVDFSEDMVRISNEFLEKNGYGNTLVQQRPVTDLRVFDDATFDVVTSLGVLYYVEDIERAYHEISRVLKPGGIFIFSHQNELFDVFTFNKYTCDFFKANILDLATNKATIHSAAVEEAFASLLMNPDAPQKHSASSARDHVFTKAYNPLTVPETIRKFGFEVSNGPLYHGFHIVPPLLEEKFPELKTLSAEMQYDMREDWRSMFMSAHFLMEAVKVG